MTEYERNIDEECKQMWNSVMMEKLKESTRTKIRAIVNSDFGKRVLAVEEKVTEHDGTLAAIKRGIMNIAGAFEKKNKV